MIPLASLIDSIALSRYRCFRDPGQIKLGRLTLVYGQNNAGKSALVRLPALLADSQQPAERGLNANSELLRGGSTRDIQWRGLLPDDDTRDTTITLQLRGAEWTWVLEWKDLERRLEVAELRLTPQGAPPSTNLAASLQGMLPIGPLPTDIQPHREALVAMLGGTTWLSTRRVGPSHLGVPVGKAGRLWGDGATAEGTVLDSAELLSGVSAFYESHTGRAVRRVGRGASVEALVLEPLGAAAPAASFPESGSGLEYMFPVVTAAQRLERQGGVLIVEEPEAHLHPRLQRALAEHLVAILVKNPAAQVLLETHSEIFLVAALEAALPEVGALGPEQVALYWAEVANDGAARLETIALDENGRPKTPRLEQAFDTMGVMRRQLLGKRRAHAG